MKKLLIAIVAISCFASCDDGDIIVTSFDFETETLERCEDFDSQFVFFKINPDNNESIALSFTTSQDIFGPGNGEEEIREITVQLSGNDNISYRRFDDLVTSDYFCNPIPPATPLVVEEFISSDGDVTIFTQGTLADNDGVPSNLEGPVFNSDNSLNIEASLDTDEDGIPNVIDFDDDGDNVPTALEGVVLNTDGTINMDESRDTDMDGVLDYLDNNDDGDSVLTINEDTFMTDLDPSNDNSDPANPTLDDYLNPNITTSVNTNAYRPHTYFLTNIIITINTQNLDFRNQNGEEAIRDIRNVPFGMFSGAPSAEIIVTPAF